MIDKTQEKILNELRALKIQIAEVNQLRIQLTEIIKQIKQINKTKSIL